MLGKCSAQSLVSVRSRLSPPPSCSSQLKGFPVIQKYNLLIAGSSHFHSLHLSIISSSLFCMWNVYETSPLLTSPLPPAADLAYWDCCNSFLVHLIVSCLSPSPIKSLDSAAEIKSNSSNRNWRKCCLSLRMEQAPACMHARLWIHMCSSHGAH